MKKLLPLITLLFIGLSANAQRVRHWVWDGNPLDSTSFTFSVNDSLNHLGVNACSIDTTGCGIWQIGPTNKTFSAASGTMGQRGIMTDTTHKYPVNANDYFILKHIYFDNTIISFTHKYQTTKGKDGCIVEFSVDSGKVWNNMKGDCNMDSTGGPGLFTENFYNKTDTLETGEQAFSGSSNGWEYSRFQFFRGLPIKTTGSGSSCNYNYDIWARFRFVSDSTADTLDGWIIGAIKVEHDDYGSGIRDQYLSNKLSIYPNPTTGSLHLPELAGEEKYTLVIITPIGQKIIGIPYRHSIDLSQYARGIYYYKVTNGETQYTGKIQLE